MDAKIQIANTTDVLEGTKVTTLAGDNLFREGVVVSDPIVGEARARCLNSTPASNEYGMSVRQVGSVDALLSLSQIDQLKTSKLIDHVTAGNLYIGGGKGTVTTNTGVVQLLNPVGSGKNFQVVAFFLAAQDNIDVRFFKNATVNSPSLRTPTNLNFGSSNSSVGVINVGISNITGGTEVGPTARLLANATADFTFPIIIPPNTSAAATFLSSALTSLDFYVTALWIEV